MFELNTFDAIKIGLASPKNSGVVKGRGKNLKPSITEH